MQSKELECQRLDDKLRLVSNALSGDKCSCPMIRSVLSEGQQPNAILVGSESGKLDELLSSIFQSLSVE